MESYFAMKKIMLLTDAQIKIRHAYLRYKVILIVVIVQKKKQ